MPANTTTTEGMSAVNVKSGLHELLTPDNCCVVFIDHQPAMTFGVANIDRQTLLNNVVGFAKAARTFHVPVILTAVESASFSGAIWPQLTGVFPEVPVIERSSMNSWEDAKLVEAVKRTGRTKLVICALWTEVCLAFPALCALGEGYEVYAVEDCSGGTSQVAHDAAISRIVQAGGVRTTWVCTMLEWQRDWARKATYNDVMQTVIEVSRQRDTTHRSAAPACPFQSRGCLYSPGRMRRRPAGHTRHIIAHRALLASVCSVHTSVSRAARRRVRASGGVLLHDGAQGACLPQETGSGGGSRRQQRRALSHGKGVGKLAQRFEH